MYAEVRLLIQQTCTSVCLLACLARTTAVVADSPEKTPAPGPPNIILIVCDNLGYGDIEVTNPNARQETPALNQLAAEGMVFKHAYAAAPVCTPSRAALMTGCYPRRISMDHLRSSRGPGHVLTPGSPGGLHPNEVTLAEALHNAGYYSLCIGKWHLGDQAPFLPTAQGFDEYFGIPYSDDMVQRPNSFDPPLPLMEGTRVIEAPTDADLLTRRCTERAVRFIHARRDRPFFLYFPEITPGSRKKPPVHPNFKGTTQNGAWGDSVAELDWSLEQIRNALSAAELSQDTVIIWTNDNGAPATTERGGSSEPLTGQAYNVSEGGLRVPLIVHWPGHIPAGIVRQVPVMLPDLFPTILNLCGQPLSNNPPIDGRDLSSQLLDQHPDRSVHDYIAFYHGNQLQAVRSGPWKYYLGGAVRVGFGERTRQQPPRLYHLTRDPRETTECFRENPAVVARIEEYADSIRQELGEFDSYGPGCRPAGHVLNPAFPVLNR